MIVNINATTENANDISDLSDTFVALEKKYCGNCTFILNADFRPGAAPRPENHPKFKDYPSS